jgi:hypothetical protein
MSSFLIVPYIIVIMQLKTEIKTSNTVAVKLRNNMNAEIAAVAEEREKLGNISDVHT